MPRRNTVLGTNEIYHVFNRSAGKIPILDKKRHLKLFLDLIDFYRFPNKLRFSFFGNLPIENQVAYLDAHTSQSPYVSIFAFALMPTHYHLLIKQVKDDGIRTFVANLQNSFSKFFNLKTDRRGALFQGPFQAKRITTEEEFLHVSRYIHLNPVTSFQINTLELEKYPWTSFSWYLNESKNIFIDSTFILDHFESRSKYSEFVCDRADYQRTLEGIKHLCFT